MLVNGVPWPRLAVARRRYRFRVLNGSNSRIYTLHLSDGSAWLQIGTDGGLLPNRCQAPASRCHQPNVQS